MRLRRRRYHLAARRDVGTVHQLTLRYRGTPASDPRQWETSADTSLVAACPNARSYRLASAFRNPVLIYIGRISCGVYLLHAVIFGVLRKSAHAIAVASATYHLFEQPSLSLSATSLLPARPSAPAASIRHDTWAITFARSDFFSQVSQTPTVIG
jgi:hypothetical protein